MVEYLRITVDDGMFQANTTAATHAALVDWADIHLKSGMATFPLAIGGNTSQERTWQIEGPAEIIGIDAAGGSSYTGEAMLDGATVTIDGQPAQVAQLVPVAATSLGLLATILVAIKAAPTITALLTRLPPGKALENDNRRKLYGYILAHPGATFREVLRGTEMAAGTARHHLNVLARSDMIVEHGHRSTLRFFENHGKFDATWQSVVLLREDHLSQVYDWLAAHPGAMQRDLLEYAETSWSWSRSTTQHRLARLIDGGLVTVQQMGRRKLYDVVNPREAEPNPGRASWT